MRPVYLTDLNIAARTLMATPAQDRDSMMTTILRRTQVADKYRKMTGRRHPEFGAGRISDTCNNMLKHPMPARCNADYLACLQIAVQTLRCDKMHNEM